MRSHRCLGRDATDFTPTWNLNFAILDVDFTVLYVPNLREIFCDYQVYIQKYHHQAHNFAGKMIDYRFFVVDKCHVWAYGEVVVFWVDRVDFWRFLQRQVALKA